MYETTPAALDACRSVRLLLEMQLTIGHIYVAIRRRYRVAGLVAQSRRDPSWLRYYLYTEGRFELVVHTTVPVARRSGAPGSHSVFWVTQRVSPGQRLAQSAGSLV